MSERKLRGEGEEYFVESFADNSYNYIYTYRKD